jgi:hypothetical protein
MRNDTKPGTRSAPERLAGPARHPVQVRATFLRLQRPAQRAPASAAAAAATAAA